MGHTKHPSLAGGVCVQCSVSATVGAQRPSHCILMLLILIVLLLVYMVLAGSSWSVDTIENVFVFWST